MSREVKRVALDFNAPLNKVWEGYEDTREGPPRCPEHGKSCLDGATADCFWLEEFCRRFEIAAENGRMGEKEARARRITWPHPYIADFVAGGFNGQRIGGPSQGMVDLFDGLVSKAPKKDLKLHGKHSHITLMRALVHLAGLPADFGTCPVCKGTGYAPGSEELPDFVPTEPPAGPGWQLWETVTSGSPISPVFPTAEKLVDWIVRNESATRRQAESLVKSGWAPSGSSDGGVFRDTYETAKHDVR